MWSSFSLIWLFNLLIVNFTFIELIKTEYFIKYFEGFETKQNFMLYVSKLDGLQHCRPFENIFNLREITFRRLKSKKRKNNFQGI